VPDQIVDFCAGKRAVLVLEEGQPEYIEQDIATLAPPGHPDAPCMAKTGCAMAGEYSVEANGQWPVPLYAELSARRLPAFDTSVGRTILAGRQPHSAALALRNNCLKPLPTRPPGFCIGCPERPVFSA
jgi:indolepyruvate ferredoxin oxidoreductase alpha subunit